MSGRRSEVADPLRFFTPTAYQLQLGVTIEAAGLVARDMTIEGKQVLGVICRMLPDGVWDLKDTEYDDSFVMEELDDGKCVIREGQPEEVMQEAAMGVGAPLAMAHQRTP